MKENRIPPHSIDSEQSVLGALMLDQTAILKVSDFLVEGDFYRRDHQFIFRAITELHNRNMPADAVTLGEWFDDNGLSELVGGLSYILEVANNTPSAANITAYAEIVKEKSRLRQLIDLAYEASEGAFNGGKSAADIATVSASKIMEISGGSRISGPRTAKAVATEWFHYLQDLYDNGKKQGVLTPWAKLNAQIGSLLPGNLYLIAGRPGMGKTTASDCIEIPLILRGQKVLKFSLEMSARQVMNRAVRNIAGVSQKFIDDPQACEKPDEQWARANAAMSQIVGAPWVIDTTPRLNINQIEVRSKREHQRSPLSLITIDNMNIMGTLGKASRADLELAEITMRLKGLAKDLNVPVLLLAQLNRKCEERANKRPTLADIRENGSAEQDADVILFLYRDDYYAEKDHRQSEYPGLVEIIPAKNRDGTQETVFVEFDGANSRMNHFDYVHPPEPMRSTNVRPIRGGLG